MRGQTFGTDGIRGRVGGPLVNPDFAACLGTAVGDVLKKQGVTDGEIVIGRDTRKSGAALRDGLTMGLTTAGFSCVDLGVVPTPAVALNTMKCGAVLGVALTASHNPASDNGFKFFQGCGRKVDNAWEGEVESLLEETGGGATVPASLENRHAEAVEIYCQFVSSQFSVGLLKGLKIVVDTANGGTSETTPRVLRSLGAELLQLGHEPDGFNINAGVGSEYPAAIAECVAAGRADLGLAHDGDGDRLVICDEFGHIMEGDEVLGIVALDWIRKGLLAERTVVGTVQCNAGLDATLKKAGGQLVRTEVGDRPVTRRMFEDGLNFGGEPSGHFVFGDCLPTGDGLIAALQLLNIRLGAGCPLAQLRKAVSLFPQALANLRVNEKLPLDSLPVFQEELAGIVRLLAGEGRVLVRYSGTEPKIRLLAEGRTEALARQTLESLLDLARNYLNTVDNAGGK